MIKGLVLLLLAGSAFVANASTITFSPNAQTISIGGTATVNVQFSGLTANQALGAYDLFVLDNSSIIRPTAVTISTNLGADLSFSGSVLAPGSVEGYDTSNVSTATLLSLQGTQPFTLFQITYLGLAPGTSSLTIGTPEYLADGSGALLANPTVVAGSITVQGNSITPTPEPSTFTLLATGGCAVLASLKRRRLLR